MNMTLFIQAQQQVSNATAIANTTNNQPFSWLQSERVQIGMRTISQWRFDIKKRLP